MKELVLQDIILNQVRRDKSPITITLITGDTLVGVIRGFDAETIIIDRENEQTMIYKSSIISVSTPTPVLREQS